MGTYPLWVWRPLPDPQRHIAGGEADPKMRGLDDTIVIVEAPAIVLSEVIAENEMGVMSEAAGRRKASRQRFVITLYIAYRFGAAVEGSGAETPSPQSGVCVAGRRVGGNGGSKKAISGIDSARYPYISDTLAETSRKSEAPGRYPSHKMVDFGGGTDP